VTTKVKLREGNQIGFHRAALSCKFKGRVLFCAVDKNESVSTTFGQ